MNFFQGTPKRMKRKEWKGCKSIKTHTALIPSLSGVSLRTVSFSSTAIISGCIKNNISDHWGTGSQNLIAHH